MQVLLNVVLAVQMIAALVMIGLVLLQHGKGADMGASFGSGSSGSLFGASGSANFLSRSTAVAATLFFCCTLGLAYFSNMPLGQRTGTGGSVLDRAAAASAPASGAAAAIPGAVPASFPQAASSASPAASLPSAGASSPAPAASGGAAIPSK